MQPGKNTHSYTHLSGHRRTKNIPRTPATDSRHPKNPEKAPNQ
jgi:hypothetical protein